MRPNLKLYEINTRVWIKRFYAECGDNITIDQVPDSYWDYLADLGIDYVWLMGVWKTCPSSIDKYCFEEGLVKEYSNALKDWHHDDVIGSPYSIDKYEINPLFGNKDNFLKLKEKLNNKGIKLMLDFVSNHYSADTELLKTNPEIFLPADSEIYGRDPYTYFRPFNNDDVFFAHGRDPFFPAWQDTIQVNYFCTKAQEFQINVLKEISNICDGVRCDMAMLTLNNVFNNTWGGALNKMGFAMPNTQFWQEAITAVKIDKPNFLFLAEAYWDLEWELQQLGFDYTYDKKLLDRIASGSAKDVIGHLYADPDYQERSCRFIENHDERRAISLLGKEKSMAAATLISTITGLKLYHDGQFEGKRIKLPVQLGREPKEPIVTCIQNHYYNLLKITKNEVFKYGDWHLLNVIPVSPNNLTYKNLIAYEWRYRYERVLVVINFSGTVSVGRVKLDVIGYPEVFELKDVLNDVNYIRSTSESYHEGLFIELKPFRAHIFFY